jgi:TPR repeat protein
MKRSLVLIGIFYLLKSYAFASTVEKAEILIYQGKAQEASAMLEPFVRQKDPKACFFMALIKLFGETPEPEQGLQMLQDAANKGYNPAIDTLAGLYLHGEFIPQDRAQARRYYEVAANRGYGPSQFNCGIMYKNGDKIPKDLESAFVYLSLAALNRQDLEELTEDAAGYRDEVARQLLPEQYQRALQRLNQIVH